MRKSAIAGVWFILVLISCKGKFPRAADGTIYRSAVEYNDYILNRQRIIVKGIREFGASMGTDPLQAKKILEDYSDTTEQLISEIKGMPAYKKDSSLRDAAVSIFGFYQRLFKNEYSVILQLRSGPDSLSDSNDDKFFEIVKKIQQEEKKYDDRFQSAQQAFARKNKIELVDDQSQKEPEKKR